MVNKLFLVILLMILSFPAFSQQCFSEKKYPVYYFLNGINVTSIEGDDSIALIKLAFKIKDMALLHNPTEFDGLTEKEEKQIDGWIDSLNLIHNVKGLYTKYIKVNYKVGHRIYNDVWNEVLPQKTYEHFMLTIPEKDRKAFSQMNSHLNVSLPLAKSYQKMLSNKSNIVFAHSQGNFVANQLCFNKGDKKLEIISIASPAGELPCNTFQNYSLFNNDVIIFGLKIRKSPIIATYEYLKPTEWSTNIKSVGDLAGHLLSTYLNKEGLVEKLKEKLVKTNDMVYQRDMNFDFLTITTKLNGSYSKNTEFSHYDPFKEKLCENNIARAWSSIVSMATKGSDKTIINDDCQELGQKSELNQYDKYKIRKNLTLGTNPKQIASTIIRLSQAPYQIFDDPGFSGLYEKLSLSKIIYKGTNIVRDLASINGNPYLSLNTSKTVISCLNLKKETRSVRLSLDSLNKGASLDVKINQEPYTIFELNISGFKDEEVGSISFSEDIKTGFTYQANLISKMDVFTNNKVGQQYFSCNTLQKLRGGHCSQFVRYLRDTVIPSI